MSATDEHGGAGRRLPTTADEPSSSSRGLQVSTADGQRARSAATAAIRVTVVWATADVQDIVPLELPPGSVVGQAVAASGLLARYAADAPACRFAIAGRIVADDAPLASGDRIEICRPLVVDPKAARRLRAAAKRRP